VVLSGAVVLMAYSGISQNWLYFELAEIVFDRIDTRNSTNALYNKHYNQNP
jgi:hypothetical protein